MVMIVVRYGLGNLCCGKFNVVLEVQYVSL
jgi:hypothetical protein